MAAATYVSRGRQTCSGDKPVGTATQTAFAYSPPTVCPCFIGLDAFGNGTDDGFNRCGWPIGALAPGATDHFELYAGAARCDVSKGTRVDTMTVEYYNRTTTVT